MIDPGLKALGFKCQPVEITSPFKVVVSDVVNLHPCTSAAASAAAVAAGGSARDAQIAAAQVPKLALFANFLGIEDGFPEPDMHLYLHSLGEAVEVEHALNPC